MKRESREQQRRTRRVRRMQRRRTARLLATAPVVLEPLERRLLFTAAVIASVDPVANSHDTPVGTDITATYDQNIDTGGSVTDTTFVVHAMFTGQIVDPPPGNTISVVADTITFNPDNDFQPGERVQVIATDAIENTLAEASQKRVWEFRVAPSGGTSDFTDGGQNLGDHQSRAVALGDLDGDGDLDAFVANFSSGNRVWINDGSANVTDSGQSLGDHKSIDVALGDLDGDGDLDAFFANRSQANRVWINDGSANFTDSGQGLGDHGSHSLSLGDLDGDGDLDAFVANYNNHGNRVWINDGSANFTDSGQSLSNHESRAVELGDLDGDGDLDAYVANRGVIGQANRVWMNDGSANFTDSGQSLGDHNGFNVSLGDLDGDGDLDAFVANGFPGEGNRVWLNQELPQVTEVLVRGSAWTQPFLNHLDSLSLGHDGYSIPVGSLDQLDAFPWLNIDQILIRFNEQVNVDLNDLVLTGVNVATYSLAGVTTGTGASGDFAFRFNVLPADFDGTGVITLNPDLQNMLAGNGASIGAGNYSPFIDLDGNGTVTLNPDLQTALGNNGSSLPAGNPSAPGSGSAGAGSSSPAGASAAAPVAAPVLTPDSATTPLRRVIAIPRSGHAMPRGLATSVGCARGASHSRPHDAVGTFRVGAVTSRGMVDLDESDAEASIDLLEEVGPIF